MKNKLVLGIAVLFFIFACLAPEYSRAATLSDLPFGSVIQITPTDTYMCNDPANCTATTNNVLPFKFVKMQARQTNTSATALGNQDGHTINGQSYTYWMLLDNYCWWGKSDCRYYDGSRQSAYASWNANGSTSGTYSNNITDTRTNNILKVLANFYDSLPANIGGIAKETAIPVFSWDMYGVSDANPPAVGWNGGTWTNTTYDPNTNVNSRFTFTGNNTAPIMNSRIGLISYHEWQGGNMALSSNPTSNNGSGGSYCFARFGTTNCAASSGYMFNDVNTAAGNQNTVASATNPRPRFPWTRSPNSPNSTYVWLLQGSTSRSLGISTALSANGVSPTLWLLSTINTAGTGAGTYANPYRLSPTTQPALSLSAPTAVWNSGSQILNLTGLFNYSQTSQSVLLWAAACNTNGQCKQKTTTVASNGSDQAYSLVWNQNELPSGTYSGTIWVGARLIASPSEENNAFAPSNEINFTISPRVIDLTVVKNRAFNLILGDAGAFNLSAGTNQGVTVAVDSATNGLTISGTLADDAQITFGSSILNFKTLDIPQSTVVNANLAP